MLVALTSRPGLSWQHQSKPGPNGKQEGFFSSFFFLLVAGAVDKDSCLWVIAEAGRRANTFPLLVLLTFLLFYSFPSFCSHSLTPSTLLTVSHTTQVTISNHNLQRPNPHISFASLKMSKVCRHAPPILNSIRTELGNIASSVFLGYLYPIWANSVVQVSQSPKMAASSENGRHPVLSLDMCPSDFIYLFIFFGASHVDRILS